MVAVNLAYIGGAGWQFFTDNGVPLSGGKIYTYAAGTTTPQATYTSNTGLTLNSNPIILDAAGRTPQQIWAVDGLFYKFVIKNANDVLVRSWDNIGSNNSAALLSADLANTTDNAKGDALIGFRQSSPSGFAPNAIARTVNAKLQAFVSPEDFGAVGDGVTNDGPALLNALQYCSNTGVPFLANGKATYLVSTSITVDRAAGYPLVIDWNGANIICSQTSGLIIGANVTPFLNTSLATNLNRDDAYVTLLSVAGLAKGDLLEILSPALTGNTISTYHYYVVNEIDGNDVYIEGTAVADVNPQQIIDSGASGVITVSAYRLAPTVTMKNATIQMVDPTGAGIFGALFQYHSKVFVENLNFTGNCRFQLSSQYNGITDVGNCTFRDMGYLKKNEGYINLPSQPGGLGYGYGFLSVRNWTVLFHDCVGLRGWHTADFSRGTMKAIISDCSFNRCAYAVSTHEGAWYTEVRDCVFDGNNGITIGRGIYGVIQGCHFRAMSSNGVAYGDQMVDLRVANNKFEYAPGTANVGSALYDDGNGPPKAGALSVGFVRTFEFVNNTIIGQCRCAVGFADSSQGQLVVKGNNFFSGGQLNSVKAALQTQISGNTFSDIGQQFAFVISVGSGNPSIVCSSNNHTGGVDTAGGSAMFALSGSGTPTMHFENNSTRTENLIRFNSNLTVKNVLNCAARGTRLFVGTGTVTNAINNYYVSAIASTTVVTNSVNNQALV